MKKQVFSKLILCGICFFAFVFHANAQELKLAFTHHSSASNTFWQAVKKGMDEACRMTKSQCKMYFTQVEGSIEQQTSNMLAVIAGKPDVLVTTIVDDKAFDDIIQRAEKQGVAVIAANVDDSEGAAGNARLSFIGQNFDAAGYNLAKKLSEKFPSKGDIKVLVGISAPGQNWSEQRGAGVMQFLEEYKKNNPSRKVSWKRIDSGTDLAITANRVGSYLGANPDTTAYLDTGFWNAGVAKVLEDRKIKPGKILLGGFDIVPQVLKYIEKGYIQVQVDQQPYLQGFLPVMQAYLMKKYKLGAWNVDTGSGLISKEDVADVIKLSKKGYR